MLETHPSLFNHLSQLPESDKELRARCLGSLLHFTKLFYKMRTSREFRVSTPIGRESHHITISRELTNIFNGDKTRLVINVPPRYGKTELLIHFICWSIARFPDCQFLYISYSAGLASDATAVCREIIQLPAYRKLFGVELNSDFTARDDFRTTAGGRVCAVGSSGTITGKGAGLRGVNRFGGAIIIDDAHKPDEAASDTIRQGVIDNYHNTIKTRGNAGELTPQIMIGQRVHEDDLSASLLQDESWDRVVLPALDIAGNPLDPDQHSLNYLLKMKEDEPYVFAAQMQQNPQPAGGGLFKTDFFPILEKDPDVLVTFITVDGAETAKTHNDATVFSFWGLYHPVVNNEIVTDLWALHWIDCAELRVEPKDLESEFMQFYVDCMQHKVKPVAAAIEKKSSGTWLLSVLQKVQGLDLITIERTSSGGSKADRFISMQGTLARKLVTFSRHGKHVDNVIKHMTKITANNTHRHDDICDTCYDAVKLSLMDGVIQGRFLEKKISNEKTAAKIMNVNRNHSVAFKNIFIGSRL